MATALQILDFDQLTLCQPSPADMVITWLEPAIDRPFNGPRFVVDLSGSRINPTFPDRQSIHGSNLVRRRNVLLFGPDNLVSANGSWTTSDSTNKGVSLAYMKTSFFPVLFPGDLPDLFDIHTAPRISTKTLADKGSVIRLDEPVFLATPLEPPTWGRWVAHVMPRVDAFLKYGRGRKLLCHIERSWELQTLVALGVRQENIIPHMPGHTYLCSDVMFVESFGAPGITLSTREKKLFQRLVQQSATSAPREKYLFVSRQTATRNNPNYRPLMNEAELAEMLGKTGFHVIEPEQHSLDYQISAFNSADTLVFTGGSALYNTAFCRPSTRVITIESSPTFINTHAGYLSSADMSYGVIFGQEDPMDGRKHHKRWRIDAPSVLEAVLSFND